MLVKEMGRRGAQFLEHGHHETSLGVTKNLQFQKMKKNAFRSTDMDCGFDGRGAPILHGTNKNGWCSSVLPRTAKKAQAYNSIFCVGASPDARNR